MTEPEPHDSGTAVLYLLFCLVVAVVLGVLLFYLDLFY
jgi:hypothetical protein